jgi:hypothetical protein
MSEYISTEVTAIKALADLDLEDLAALVRSEIQQARKAWCLTLGHAMAAGDALIAVQPKVTERGIAWKKWLRENCFVGVSTAQLYQQLARHRDKIEAELQSKGELSLRGARQLISTTQDDDDGEDADCGGQDETEDSPGPETLVDHYRRSPGELRALLDVVTVEGVLEAMSEEFGRQLRARLPAPKRKSGKPGKPFKHTLTLEAHSARHGRGTHSRH